jgi:hypothetical protein
LAATTQVQSELPSAVFDAPLDRASGGLISGRDPLDGSKTQRCPDGLVGVGISGRSGVWLDAVGLICGELVLTRLPSICDGAREARARNSPDAPFLEAECRAAGETPPAKIGRVKVDGASGAPGPPQSICQLAREARARNSPAAPGLEAQCRAAGAAGETPPAKIGRVKVDENVEGASGPPQSICELAREARARNSPAASGLEAQCLEDLAGMGAAIAEQDPDVAAGRAAEGNVLYRRGFDIATGIFGDPALGAQGNTATGPGSLKIRDSLSAAGQRGFNASVKLHLSRNYRP